MKLRILTIVAVAISQLAFAGNNLKNETLTVDTKKSTLEWTGRKPGGEHKGTVNVSNGSLEVNGGKITGGKFVIDLSSITCTDLQGEWADKLVGHLKNDDFFNTEKFATSEFQIASVKAIAGETDRYEISGKLTIKGVTNDISFPASVKGNDKSIVAVGKISIDRTKFGINYSSKSVFKELTDKFIEDMFDLDVKIIAVK